MRSDDGAMLRIVNDAVNGSKYGCTSRYKAEGGKKKKGTDEASHPKSSVCGETGA